MKRKKNNEIEVTPSSGNVYADFGHPNPREAMAKAELALLISDLVKKKKLTQKKAAVLMGIDQPKVSAIMRGQLSGFTIERLFRFLLAFGMDIVIEAKVHRKRSAPEIFVSHPFIPNSSSAMILHEEEHEYLTQKDLEKKIKEYEKLMKKAAKEHRFEDAARFRDLMHKYQKMEMTT